MVIVLLGNGTPMFKGTFRNAKNAFLGSLKYSVVCDVEAISNSCIASRAHNLLRSKCSDRSVVHVHTR